MTSIPVFIDYIEWDREVDGELDLAASLPEYIDRFTVEVNEDYTQDELSDAVANSLSDEYGFCVFDVVWYQL